MNLDLTPSMSRIVDVLKVWVIGGALRDLFLDKTPKDIDLCTDVEPPEVRKIITNLGLTIIPDLTAQEHGITRCVDKDDGSIIDIATLRRDTTCDGRHAKVEFTTDLLADLERRDLTINAMAAKISPDGSLGEIIDLYNGQQDILDKTIRFVGNPCHRIKEDHLRIIRACRFTALGEGWNIRTTDFQAITDLKQGIHEISKERIRDEILKALAYDKPSNFFRTLHAAGLLAIIFPDLARGVGCEQNEHHAEPVFDHLLRCGDFSTTLTRNLLLRLACFTHDIAKPHTRSTGIDGRIHFYKHEVEGASVMYRWMREYRFSRKDIEYVTKLVRFHQWRFEDNSKDKTIRKWLQAVGKGTWRDLVTLRCADRKGNLKKADRPMITQKMRELMERAQNIIDSGAAIFKEDLAINGHDLKDLGVLPGKIYKEIFSNMLGIVISDPNKNNKVWLSEYVTRNYTKGSHQGTV